MKNTTSSIKSRIFSTGFALALFFCVSTSINFGAISSSANSDDVLHLQENKTFLSQLSVAGELANYLQANKKSGVLSEGLNPFNNGQIKPSPDDFAVSGELYQDGLAPQEQGCDVLNFAATNFSVGTNPRSVTTGDFIC